MGEIEDIQQANVEHFMERGPALSYAYSSYVVARRPSTGEVLLGGLGGMGLAQMWFQETESHVGCPGYADAEIIQ